jgi:hypothetical protein
VREQLYPSRNWFSGPDANCPGKALAQALTFDTLSGEKYFIAVTSEREGYFGFRLNQFDPPPNDLCENAIGPVATDGTRNYGSTINATARVDVRTTRSYGGSTVFYAFEGDGGALVVSACSISPDLHVKVFVHASLSGGDCGGDNLYLLNPDNQDVFTFCQRKRRSITLPSTPGRVLKATSASASKTLLVLPRYA